MDFTKTVQKLAFTVAIAGGIASLAMPAEAIIYNLSGRLDSNNSVQLPGENIISGTLEVTDAGGGLVDAEWNINITSGQTSDATGNQAIPAATSYLNLTFNNLGIGIQGVNASTVVGPTTYFIDGNIFVDYVTLFNTPAPQFFTLFERIGSPIGPARFSEPFPPDALLLTPVPFEFSPAMGLALVGGLFAADQARRKMKKEKSVKLGKEEVTA
jgi:hypothetical protein